jgi:hypothetical protein
MMQSADRPIEQCSNDRFRAGVLAEFVQVSLNNGGRLFFTHANAQRRTAIAVDYIRPC